MKNRRRIIIALVLVAVFAVGAVLYLTVLGPALEPEETVKVPIETQQGEAIDTTDRIQIFPRITAELRLSENTSCMICGDVGDLTGGGRTALLCELELELKQGSEEALSAFARALMDTYHLSEQPLSKLQRARALAE